jgi:hypothetical protein
VLTLQIERCMIDPGFICQVIRMDSYYQPEHHNRSASRLSMQFTSGPNPTSIQQHEPITLICLFLELFEGCALCRQRVPIISRILSSPLEPSESCMHHNLLQQEACPIVQDPDDDLHKARRWLRILSPPGIFQGLIGCLTPIWSNFFVPQPYYQHEGPKTPIQTPKIGEGICFTKHTLMYKSLLLSSIILQVTKVMYKEYL